jgi:AraC-like DNA-binding protein
MEEVLDLPAGLDGTVWQYRWASLLGLYPMHRHAELEVNLVLDGTASYVMRERRYDLVPGTIVWLFPLQDHLLMDQSPNYQMWIVLFKPELVRRVCVSEMSAPLTQGDPAGHFARRLDAARAARLDRLFRDLRDVTAQGDHFNAGLGYALLTAWAAYLQADDLGGGHDIHPAVERAARLLHERTEPLGLEEIARDAGLSPSHLCRLFKDQMALSMVAFRHRQHLDRFLGLYGNGRRRTLMAAALDAGFGSYAQFYRVFSRYMGCTPAVYRRRLTAPNERARPQA